jgi:hypothetical protein
MGMIIMHACVQEPAPEDFNTNGRLRFILLIFLCQQNSCGYNSNYRGATQSGFVQIKSGDESALLAAVYSVGPIAVAVDARSKAFKVRTHVFGILRLETNLWLRRKRTSH